MSGFFKLSGAGNDFIALAEPERDPEPATIRLWCRRGVSIGADGVFVLRRRVLRGRENQLVLRYFNSDGLEADLCLNASRCAVRLADELGWAESPMQLDTPAGLLTGGVLDSERTFIEAPVETSPPRPRTIETVEKTYSGWLTRVGVPHFVVFIPTELLATLDVERHGARLRSHPNLGDGGANVDFVAVASVNRLSLRTFERGIEGETLACGTGVVAAALCGVAGDCSNLPVRVVTRAGFEFSVDTEPTPEGSRWTLMGDARLVAEGRFRPGAEGAGAC